MTWALLNILIITQHATFLYKYVWLSLSLYYIYTTFKALSKQFLFAMHTDIITMYSMTLHFTQLLCNITSQWKVKPFEPSMCYSYGDVFLYWSFPKRVMNTNNIHLQAQYTILYQSNVHVGELCFDILLSQNFLE